MTRYFCFLAQLDGLNALNPAAPVAKSTGLVFMNVLAIIASALALGSILLLWARYYVPRSKRPRHLHRERTRFSYPAPFLSDEADQHEHDHHDQRRRRRRYRRDHRPRNPTLGQSGGLPPPRTEPSSDPPL